MVKWSPRALCKILLQYGAERCCRGEGCLELVGHFFWNVRRQPLPHSKAYSNKLYLLCNVQAKNQCAKRHSGRKKNSRKHFASWKSSLGFHEGCLGLLMEFRRVMVDPSFVTDVTDDYGMLVGLDADNEVYPHLFREISSRIFHWVYSWTYPPKF